jgi:hypothetical protein
MHLHNFHEQPSHSAVFVRRSSLLALLVSTTLLTAVLASGCSSDGDDDGMCTECGEAGASGTGAQNGSGGTASGGTSNAGDGGQGGENGSAGQGTGSASSGGQSNPIDPPADECEVTIQLADTSSPDHVVGTGSPESCTSQALALAAEQGGIVTFDCGPATHTIVLERCIELPTDVDTVVDGGGKIEIDGNGEYRHFTFDSPGWQTNETSFTLQRVVLRNGLAPLGEYFPPVEGNPECAYGYKEGSGGAIYMRDGVLNIIDSQFYDNRAAMIGPDVGGGAVYAQGVFGVNISGSVFRGNRAANGGAVGMLFANPTILNSIFEDNTAEGFGMNTAGHTGCPEFGHEEQGGAGGLAGAVYFDGMNFDDFVYTICGSVFRNNRANELAGALFRTPNSAVRDMLIDRSVFDGNTAQAGAVSFIKQNDLIVRGSTFMNNRAGVLVDGTEESGPFGGLWLNESTLQLENSTFADNLPSGLNVEGTGSVRNTTFFGSDIGGGLSIDNSLLVNTECDDAATGANNVAWPNDGGCGTSPAIADPTLGAPADNGGPTPTSLPGNVAAVSGVGTECPAFDQRGEPRDTASCAAGAVEVE